MDAEVQACKRGRVCEAAPTPETAPTAPQGKLPPRLHAHADMDVLTILFNRVGELEPLAFVLTFILIGWPAGAGLAHACATACGTACGWQSVLRCTVHNSRIACPAALFH